MRYILGLDTAGADGSAALAGEGESLIWEPLPPGGHSGVLSEAVARLLRAREISLSDLAAIAASEGPGSFTGLRIGLAWAKGAALGRSLPLVLVSAHEAAAHAHRARSPRVATLIAGERGKVEAALWEGGGRARLLWGPEPVEESEVVERLVERARAANRTRAEAPAGAPPILALAPSGARLTAEIESQIESDDVLLIPAAPLAPAVAELGDRRFLEGRVADWAAASPAYGRAPNARRPTA